MDTNRISDNFTDMEDHPEYTTQEDVLQAVKAVRDGLRKEMESALQSVKSSLVFDMGKMLESALSEFRKNNEQRVKSIRDEYEKSIKSLCDQHASQLTALNNMHGESLQKLTEVIKSLGELPPPTVNVNVPSEAIEVKMLPSQVIVPSEAIMVKMLPSQVIVPNSAIEVKMLPSQVVLPNEAIRVEVGQPNIQVSVPQPRLVKKSISYDEYGRPAEIQEHDAGD